MADCEVRLRYHELVDKHLAGTLTTTERTELERIEISLDSEDRDPVIAWKHRSGAVAEAVSPEDRVGDY
jgi:hypothetical protein